MDIIERYKQLKEKQSSLSSSLTSEEATFKTLKQQYDSDLATLCSTYSVNSVEEAQALLTKSEQELTDLINKAESALNIVDAPSSL